MKTCKRLFLAAITLLMILSLVGTSFAASDGDIQTDPTQYKESFNRPGVYQGNKWVTATPVFTTGTSISYCDLLVALGYAKDGTPDNAMKTFHNTWNGNQLSGTFEKCHWDNNGESHGGCGNDYIGENGITLEVYRIGDKQYRNVLIRSYLAKVENGRLWLYGERASTWGPWAIAGLPANGFYIVNYHWNAYGLGEGLNIVRKATAVRGTLDGMDGGANTWINGAKTANSSSFNLGFTPANTLSNYNEGKRFTFLYDQYGYVVGCTEEAIPGGNCSHTWQYVQIANGARDTVSPTHHERVCTKCATYSKETHAFGPWTQVTDEKMSHTCTRCGYTATQNGTVPLDPPSTPETGDSSLTIALMCLGLMLAGSAVLLIRRRSKR